VFGRGEEVVAVLGTEHRDGDHLNCGDTRARMGARRRRPAVSQAGAVIRPGMTNPKMYGDTPYMADYQEKWRPTRAW